ncbi:YtpI family protein [Paenibacillus sp. HW567]|uniref:YtpI family protein n=1 Tax=Paenibacillus sp. HW567 TaxID=1034769 RepID=UPI000364FF10|nr:YtpI family protein [Paenibacillus sp. HW567]
MILLIKYFRAQDPLEKGITRSVMNIMPGGMLLSLCLICMFTFRGSTSKVIVEALFLLLGAFNISG